MNSKHKNMSSGGFVERPEWLFVVALICVVAAAVLPVARKIDLGILGTVGVIVGILGAFVLWLQHRNIMDWLRDRKCRRKTNETHDA